MFTDVQLNHLKAPLEKTAVLSRKQGGRNVSYIEGWHAIAEANRIFGFGKWDRETELHRLCEPYEAESSSNNKTWRVSFMATVKITVRPEDETTAHSVTREGVGYGSGAAKDIGDAYESAIKEAETDAMKRALMTFGNQFGLALYDKQQRNVSDGKEEARELYAEIARFIKETGDPATLRQGMQEFGWGQNAMEDDSPIAKIHNASAVDCKKLIGVYSEKLKNMNQKERSPGQEG